MNDLQNWVEQYLLTCQYQKGLNAKTLKAYRIDLSQFILFMEQLGQDGSGLTRSSVAEFIAGLHQQYKPRTIRRKIASLKAFFGYLEYGRMNYFYKNVIHPRLRSLWR